MNRQEKATKVAKDLIEEIESRISTLKLSVNNEEDFFIKLNKLEKFLNHINNRTKFYY